MLQLMVNSRLLLHDIVWIRKDGCSFDKLRKTNQNNSRDYFHVRDFVTCLWRLMSLRSLLKLTEGSWRTASESFSLKGECKHLYFIIFTPAWQEHGNRHSKGQCEFYDTDGGCSGGASRAQLRGRSSSCTSDTPLTHQQFVTATAKVSIHDM